MGKKYSENYGGRERTINAKDTWKIRDAILKEIGFSSYSDFLNSEYWKRIKEKAFNRKYYHKCSICGSYSNIELHHKHYDLMGNANELNAILPVCRLHHELIHEYQKLTNTSLRFASREVPKLYRLNQLDSIMIFLRNEKTTKTNNKT